MEKINGKWVVAVSGGADSMALLDKCYRLDMDVIAAHVNYKKRDTSDRDADGVETYCRRRGIPFFKHIVSGYRKGNFQSVARDIRYNFFKTLIDEYGCEGVLVAHHKDDLIETYLIQIGRNSIPEYYGIKEEILINNCLVKRPLLKYTKKDLEEYCHTNKIEYYDDETNASNLYTRNVIRHTQIEKMSNEEKDEIVATINELNSLRADSLEIVNKYLKTKDIVIDLDSFKQFDESIQLEILRSFILNNSDLNKVSLVNLKKLNEQFKTYKHNFKFVLGEYTIFNDYGKLSIHKQKAYRYKYILTDIEELSTKYFSTKFHGNKIQGLYVENKDLPIMIRNYQEGDRIKLRIGTKKVSRFFIDRKIPIAERKLWPVVVNKNGEIIFVAGIGCDVNHYSNNYNMFVIK